jgi:hypothetical protein
MEKFKTNGSLQERAELQTGWHSEMQDRVAFEYY